METDGVDNLGAGRNERRFVLILALLCAALAALPTIYAWIASPPGSLYLGTEWATDDHMVYAAWTRQAMHGSFLFDNRFTTDPQPGLTIHLYFWAVGQIARVTGVTVALSVVRVVLSFAFVWLAYGFIRRLTQDGFLVKLGLVLATFGGGIGYLVWHKFGEEITLPKAEFLREPMLGRLPTDVWQPEGFVFPSMLTTGLFVASLCLMLVIFRSFLDARESWKPVLTGALAMLALMNIHSYDVLLIGLVMGGFLAMSLVRRQVTAQWLFRALVIAAGAVPSALWFSYVLNNDPVFRARAATETFSANFRQIAFGYIILIVLGLIASAIMPSGRRSKLHSVGAAIIAGLLVALFVSAGAHAGGYWMNLPVWLGLYAGTLAVLCLLARESPAVNLVVAWAMVGLIAVYFPGLFQRKLAMGLVVPWAILAALGFGVVTASMERSKRRLIAVLAGIACCGSSALWLQRDLAFASSNVSRTTVQPVFLSSDMAKIVAALDKEPGRKTVLVVPGMRNPAIDENFDVIPDDFFPPSLPDLNPIVSGLTGAYTYAGHWSETPDYGVKRARLQRFFARAATQDERSAFLRETGANYVVAPSLRAYAPWGFADLSSLGETLVSGERFSLIRLK